ncbi:Endo-1,4-beta-xylanase, GH35 family [Fictibacillus solisalsi]|uniref:Beta-xylanase n=1 Tax=Fictibacillus solisalsi TaxID=459525 RepID=A0A1G9VTR3_9BACL|nr:endo-1,4-beta-xylanase [Fictibacillus solisalsi]SDM75367.1 Endo-1,4-beta-xylanase, GH35 family [Fictibacillus solisalsi]
MKKKARNLLTYFLALVFTLSSFPVTALPVIKASAAEGVNEKASSNSATEVVSLKEVYKDYFLIGNTISPGDLTDTAKYDFMKFHYNALTPENATKPDSIWSNPTRDPSFTSADNMLTKVKADGFYTIGHALAWHNQSAGWPQSGQNYTEARASLKRYISTIAGHYSEGPYKLNTWDVVNEAMRDNPENPTDWRNALRSGIQPTERPSRWFEAYANGGNGWDYIYDAFLFAREAAPNAILYYNDFNDEELPNKAIAIASMVNELNERYANEHPKANGRKLIEGIGIQGHYNLRLKVDNLDEVLKIYSETGCEISITELDVQFNGTSADVPPNETQLKEQAKLYAKLFMLYKKYSNNIERVTFWGVSDNNSWRRTGYPLPFDSSRTPKEGYWAIINPEAYLGLDDLPPKLTSFDFAGDVFNVAGKTEFDVNVPKDVSKIDFSAANIAHEYPDDDVDVSVKLNPASGTVSAEKPAVATVKIARKDSPKISTTYTVNFGHMTAEWEKDQNYKDTGYRSTVKIRFSDGETKFKLFQEFYNRDDGKLAMLNSKEIQPLPKHTGGTFSINTDSSIDDDHLKTLTLKKSLWNQKWTPINPARVTDFTVPENFWRMAKTIESGKTYIVVSANSGVALTNRNVTSVPATGGVTNAKRGLAGTPVTIVDDVIVAPKLIQDNMRFIFNESTSPDPGPYTSANGYTGYNMLSLVHGGLVAPSILWRDLSSDMTASLRTDTTIGDNALDRAVWFNTGIDPDTGETTLFSHTGSSNYTYALHGNENGFVGQGGTDPLEDYAADSRVKLYEYVSNYSYEDLTSLGVEISHSPVERIVSERNANIPLTADVPDGSKAVLKKDGVSVASATFANGKAMISVKGSDVDGGANYAVVVYDGSELLGAVILPVVTVVNATPKATVEKLNGNQNKLTITVTEVYADDSKEAYTKEVLIRNNAADVYQVGPYKVYVDTKGNNKIHKCYIVKEAEQQEAAQQTSVQ